VPHTPGHLARHAFWLVLAALPAAAQVAPAPHDSDDPAATASDWHSTTGGVSLGVSRIGPAQARAFYRARGFDAAAAAHYADACVFQVVLRNDAAGGLLTYHIEDWRITNAATVWRFVPLETWEQEWARRGVAEPARIAFRWAQFPAEHTFAAGDWIMGMAALAPRPPGSFDLNYEWSIDGVSHRGTLSGLRCADAD
jgi:hypothetical protein